MNRYILRECYNYFMFEGITMKSIYIVVSHTGTWLSHLIRWFTNSEYTHVSIAFDSSLKELFSFGRKQPSNPFKGGFVIESIDSEFFKRFDNTQCRIYEIKTSVENYNRLKERIQYFVEHKEIFKYNVLGLITYMFRYSLNRRNAYFCSQFVATVLSESEIITLTNECGLVKPMDFTQIEGAIPVYEGKILDYHSPTQLLTQ